MYSDLIIRELQIKYSLDAIFNDIFSIVFDILSKINIYEKQTREAFVLSRKLNLPFGDIMHAILARDNNCILISRDKHFDSLIDIVEIKKPEELI